ncbi:YwqG family protein [Microcoleus sp. N3A4]|uniref:YwqG family protein n=1 Tax=Microcoleus sp. N3A4 TaxID=3055379 RepID=UPI002FD19E73
MKTNLELPAELEPFRQEIESSEKPVIKITYERKATDFWSSKFGGVPYLPKGYDFPKDSDGKYMHLLAQLNFEEIFAQVPYLAPFPKQGILQFYIGETDLYGMDLDNFDNQKDFKILYFSEIDTNNCQTDFAFLLDLSERYSTLNNQKLSALQFVYKNNSPTDNLFNEHIFEHYSPLKHEYVNNSPECLALQFSPDNEWVCPEDYQINNILEAQKVKQLFEVMSADDYKIFDWYYANLYEIHHKIGGYGYFPQTDPREYSPQYKDHKVVLLHMISDDEICWGDCGVGNFLIRAEDLENLDFSQVIYNYGCS